MVTCHQGVSRSRLSLNNNNTAFMSSAFASGSPSMNTHGPISLRKSGAVFPDPIPEQYEFLKVLDGSPNYHNIRHPAYPADDNHLFTLKAVDHEQGGIHYCLAHNACSIIADNRTDGYLSTSCDGEHGTRVACAWDDVLSTAVTDYYFYVPYPSGLTSPSNDEHENRDRQHGPRPPYRWPVVATFHDWKFPGKLPEVWTRCAHIQRMSSNLSRAQSNFAFATHLRDRTCQITPFVSGTEAAHLVPEHEKQWFMSNRMSQWNSDGSLDPDYLLRDLGNAVLLRSDMHTAFDQREFVFFPKDSQCFVVHMLNPVSDIGPLYHNTRLSIPGCKLQFLFARFAWSIFPYHSGFLGSSSRSRLIIRVTDTGERVAEEIEDFMPLRRKAVASRGNSPKKRARSAADSNDKDLEYTAKRQRSYEGMIAGPSFNPTTVTSDEEADCVDESPAANSTRSACHVDNSRLTHLHNQLDHFEKIRQEALARQRPAGYDPWIPPYDRYRPAMEELELMGVGILSDLGSVVLTFDDGPETYGV